MALTFAMNEVKLRKEHANDIEGIRHVVSAAFENHPHSNQTEHLLVDSLREAGALTISLIAELHGRIIGHIAFSPVTINGKPSDWYGLGPVSVRPDLQGKGIGRLLIKAGLAELHSLQSKGCVLLGDPGYYGRFGFVARDGLTLAGFPTEHFQARSFSEEIPQGAVSYHKAFEVCG